MAAYEPEIRLWKIMEFNIYWLPDEKVQRVKGDGRPLGVWVEDKESSMCENLQVDSQLARTTESTSLQNLKIQAWPVPFHYYHSREQTKLIAA